MAVKIEKGGWFLIFLLGAGITGYSLWKYGLLDKIAPSAKTTVPLFPNAPTFRRPLSPANPKVTPVGVARLPRPAAPTSPRCAC